MNIKTIGFLALVVLTNAVKKSFPIFAIGLPAGSVLAGDNGGGTHTNLTIHADDHGFVGSMVGRFAQAALNGNQ